MQEIALSKIIKHIDTLCLLSIKCSIAFNDINISADQYSKVIKRRLDFRQRLIKLILDISEGKRGVYD